MRLEKERALYLFGFACLRWGASSSKFHLKMMCLLLTKLEDQQRIKGSEAKTKDENMAGTKTHQRFACFWCFASLFWPDLGNTKGIESLKGDSNNILGPIEVD